MAFPKATDRYPHWEDNFKFIGRGDKWVHAGVKGLPVEISQAEIFGNTRDLRCVGPRAAVYKIVLHAAWQQSAGTNVRIKLWDKDGNLGTYNFSNYSGAACWGDSGRYINEMESQAGPTDPNSSGVQINFNVEKPTTHAPQAIEVNIVAADRNATTQGIIMEWRWLGVSNGSPYQIFASIQLDMDIADIGSVGLYWDAAPNLISANGVAQWW